MNPTKSDTENNKETDEAADNNFETKLKELEAKINFVEEESKELKEIVKYNLDELTLYYQKKASLFISNPNPSNFSSFDNSLDENDSEDEELSALFDNNAITLQQFVDTKSVFELEWEADSRKRVKKLKNNFYDIEYYEKLDPKYQRPYKFWIEKYETKCINTEQYLKWEKFLKKEVILDLGGNLDENDYQNLMEWLFIKFNNYQLLETLEHKKIKHQYLNYDNLHDFNLWWDVKCHKQEIEFIETKRIIFNSEDFSLTETKIAWGIICIKNNIIAKYFINRELELRNEDIIYEEIDEYRKIWIDLLWLSLKNNPSMLKNFSTTESMQTTENIIKNFLNTVFTNLKIIINMPSNINFWNYIRSSGNNEQFIEEIFKDLSSETIKGDFLTFLYKNINVSSKFKLDTTFKINLFNKWLLEQAIKKFVKDNQEKILNSLVLTAVSKKDFNAFIDSLIAEVKLSSECNSIVENEKSYDKLVTIFKKIIDQKNHSLVKLENFLQETYVTSDPNKIKGNEAELHELFYKVGKTFSDYATPKIEDFYKRYVLTAKSTKAYEALKIKLKHFVIKYSDDVKLNCDYLNEINENDVNFTKRCEKFTDDVILYLFNQNLLKDQIKGMSQKETLYTAKFLEIFDFLKKYNINFEMIKNITNTTSFNETYTKNNVANNSNASGIAKTETISYSNIPENHKIRRLVKEYMLMNQMKKLQEPAKTEPLLEKINNYYDCWNDIKVWITKNYLPPQIYFNLINVAIFLPITNIYLDLINNFNNYDSDFINQILFNTNKLTNDIVKIIYEHFICKDNKYLQKIKNLMNIELTVATNSKKILTLNYADALTFDYDHLLRNLYLIANEQKTLKIINNFLNFKGIHRLDSLENYLVCFSGKRLSTKSQPIAKHLEYLDAKFKGDIKINRTGHGCSKKRITNPIICRAVERLLNSKRELFKLLQLEKQKLKI